MKKLISSGIGVALLAALALSVVAGTSPAGQSPAYVYDSKVDLFGYYLPNTDVSVGKFKLNHLALGGQDDFKKYLAGNRMATYAPVMIAFDDVTSPQKTNETGQPYYTNAPRVLPTAFKVSGASVTFEGHDKQLGDVKFAGALAPYMIDPKFKPEARPAMSMPALTGDLTVNGKTQKVVFTWFGGD
jgi:hypothetical protein